METAEGQVAVFEIDEIQRSPVLEHEQLKEFIDSLPVPIPQIEGDPFPVQLVKTPNTTRGGGRGRGRRGGGGGAKRQRNKSDDDSDSGEDSSWRKRKAVPRGRRSAAPPSKPKRSEGQMFVDSLLSNKTAATPTVAIGEPYLQQEDCIIEGKHLSRCRECQQTKHKDVLNIFCRFIAFRKLKKTSNAANSAKVLGFSLPSDAEAKDIAPWLANKDKAPEDLDVEKSKFLLRHVGDQFCMLIKQEIEAVESIHIGENRSPVWKKAVEGVREMCDACDTTLFNIHWACQECGFVVCLDCYKSRKNGETKDVDSSEDQGYKDEYGWLLCDENPHDQAQMMLTQFIAGDAMNEINKQLHEARVRWNIPFNCECKVDTAVPIVKVADEVASDSKPGANGASAGANGSAAKPTAKAAGNPFFKKAANPFGIASKTQPKERKTTADFINEARKEAATEGVKIGSEAGRIIEEKDVELHFFLSKRGLGKTKLGGGVLPRVMSLTESLDLYPKTPHDWLCDGKLLRLKEPTNPNNLQLFQDQWVRGQPVMVSSVSGSLDMNLWHPTAFSRDFGNMSCTLVDCHDGSIINDSNVTTKVFWAGFEYFKERKVGSHGLHQLLKLKDWPPDGDFAEVLPTRFTDLMKVLPLPQYSRRDGCFNIANRLPDGFLKPDLGPKMYNAYGSALYPSKGTTNLHLDMSDAVNVMVYVGVPRDGDDQQHIMEALRAIDQADCDMLTRLRVRVDGEKPGAIWHIFRARDADKIRDLLNKVATERGLKIEKQHDPIHDQSWYLDGELRKRLQQEYGVEGYAIAQCLGDAVFIPAGAPHQVRNLHSCIKVAEDFVSPENVTHCFSLTQEFRDLSETHTNHEDKLQIKNIIYHTVKDALSVLLSKDTAAVGRA